VAKKRCPNKQLLRVEDRRGTGQEKVEMKPGHRWHEGREFFDPASTKSSLGFK